MMKSDEIKSVVMLAGIAVAGLLAWTVYKKAGAVVDKVSAGAAAAANYVNPWNQENVFAQGVNGLGGAVVSDTGAGRNADGSWTLGGWAFDTFNPEISAKVAQVNQPVFTGGATGRW